VLRFTVRCQPNDAVGSHPASPEACRTNHFADPGWQPVTVSLFALVQCGS
jgi:hypothetical protein